MSATLHFRLLTTLALAGTLVACGGTGAPGSEAAPGAGPARGEVGWDNPDIGEPLAWVGGVPIGSREFDALAARQAGRDGALSDEVRQDVLDRLIKEKLLYKAAVDRGIDRDPKIQKMMVNTLLKQEVYGEVRSTDFSDDELRAYFEEHKDEFIVPAKVQVKRLLLKRKEGEDAAAFEARIRELHDTLTERPDDFRALAQKSSDGPYARRGGDLGFLTKDGKPGIESAVIERAFELKKGELSEPFLTDAGWNLVLAWNVRQRVERTFEQMKGSVVRKVKSQRYKELYDGYVDGLRATTEVKIDEKKLAAHEIDPGQDYSRSGPVDFPASGEPANEKPSAVKVLKPDTSAIDAAGNK